MITVKNLIFEYNGTTVLHDVNLYVKKGSITALVGPNGAGKSTLIRCIAGMETAISGDITVDNINVFEKPRDVHKIIGYLSDFFGLYDDLTVKQNLTYMAWCHELPDSKVSARVNDIIQLVELEKYQDKPAGTLSRGYRQRLGIGLSLLHSPTLLLLDEPASGMDPEARIKFSRLMKRLKDMGHTMLVSSHILAELEDYCTDMLVIRDGKIVEHVFLEDHKAEKTVVLTIGITDISDEHLEIISSQKEITKVTKLDNGIVEAQIIGGQDIQHKLLKRLLNKKLAIYKFATRQKSLQNAYMYLAEDSKKEELKNDG